MLEPTHLIADLTCYKGLDSKEVVEEFMRRCIDETYLTIRHFYIEEFTNEGTDFGPGITGMALLSESNMVVHTAPERQMLNLDLFSCQTFPVGVIRNLIDRFFGPFTIDRWEILRR
tara:strand:+ start:2826 stop:3173 length:348 start_codon:yes stop_codon:yes gene_type:complete